MTKRNLSSHTALLSLIVPLAMAVSLSGCLLLGVGAAAVGGCHLLDRNEDDQVTQAELTAGIYNEWDANNNGSLSQAEFNAGVATSQTYDDWEGHFDDWDDDSDNNLSESEFHAGVTADTDTAAWLDSECDDLGL